MSERLKRHPVDYVVTFDDCFPSLVTAYIAGIPGVHLFNSLQNIESFLRAAPPYRKMLSTRRVVVVSRFLQERVKKDLNVQSSICHPIIDLGRYAAQTRVTKGPAIGFYTDGSPFHKGDELVCRIVEKLPETHFVVVGKGFLHPWDEIPGSVEYRGLVSDMRTFYGDISVLLVPSFVEEGHPRVILEAAANGIPAIANRIGGIPEALGASGILIETGPGDNLDIERLAKRYVDEIRELLRDGDTYARLSEKARRRALEYAEMQQGITLSSLLSRSFGYRPEIPINRSDTRSSKNVCHSCAGSSLTSPALVK
jgi:glycosyltransferase involved in cell wall biosynthesis